MKFKIISLQIIFAAAFSFSPFVQPQSAFGQAPAKAATEKKPLLPDRDAFALVKTDETAAADAANVPRADLTIKRMCIDRAKDSSGVVRVLFTNAGTADAGAFETGFSYINAEGGERFVLEKVAGLKAGEEKWLDYFHYCCGWAPVSLVNSSTAFEAIADPKYYAKNPFGGAFEKTEVKSKIPESNEANNRQRVDKSALEDCTVLQKKEMPAPTKVNTIKPPLIRKP